MLSALPHGCLDLGWEVDTGFLRSARNMNLGFDSCFGVNVC